MSWEGKGCTGKCVQRGSKINVLGGGGGVWLQRYKTMSWGERVVQGSVSSGGPKLLSWGGGGYGAEVKYHVLGGKGCTGKCVQRGSKINVLGGGGGGVWCRGFMSWGDTLIIVISRGVQLFYGIAHFWP